MKSKLFMIPMLFSCISYLPVVSADEYEPLPWDICQMIHDDLVQAFGLEFELYEGDFSNYNTDETGKGCIISATTSGDTFNNASDVMDKVKENLVGWSENESYLAVNDENNAATAVERDSGIILISAGKELPAGADCPDGPIEACGLSDSELVFRIELKAAMK